MPKPLPPGVRRRVGVTLTIDPTNADNLRAWSAVSEVSQARIVDAALRQRLDALLATATPEQREAFVVAGGALP